MKKIFILCSFILLFSLVGCSNFVYDLKIRNDSSFDIEFTVDNKTTYKLNVNQAITISNDNPDKIIKLLNNPRVNINQTFMDCIFTDMEYKEVTVYNTLSFNIVLSENNGYIGQTYGETVTVNSNSSATFLLYTDKPSYSAYTIIDNKEAAVDISNLIFY